MTIRELWLLLRNKPVKYRLANMSLQNYPDVVDRDYFASELQRRTTERDYHIRMADKLAEIINELRPALVEAERFMSYFAGETGGTFVGPGTPQKCLEQIRAALAFPPDSSGVRQMNGDE